MYLIAVFLLISSFLPADPPETGQPDFLVREGAFIKGLVFSGELQAMEKSTVKAPRLSSTRSLVITYLIAEGSTVREGDILVRFDVSELEAKKLELEKSREDARIRIAQKEAELETREQDLLLGHATADKNLKVARLYRGISPELIPRADAERYRFEFEKATSELEKASERLQTLEKSKIAEMEVVKLDFLEADLRLKRLESEIRRTIVRAPIPGLVVYGNNPSRSGKIQVGDQLWAGWPIIHLPNMNSAKVEAFVYDSDFPRLEGGEPAEVVLDAYPERVFRGTVSRLSEIAKSRQFRSQLKAFSVDVPLSEVDLELMKPGMTARVRVSVKRGQGLIIPRRAVRMEGDGTTRVLCLRDSPEWIGVKVLDANETELLVDGDLSPGERLSSPDWLEERSRKSSDIEWIPVTREDLRFHISGNGSLEAARSVQLGPPPIRNTWQFKIVSLIPEGQRVKKGDLLVAFDPSEVHKQLREERANLEKVEEELEKTAATEELSIKDLETQIEEAKVHQEKAHNKLLQAREFESNLKVKEAEYDAELSDKRVAFLTRKLQSKRRNVELQLQILEDRKTLHQQRIGLYMEALDSLNVKAPIDGVVIYETNWRNEKKQIGSQVFRMEKVMSLPDLDTLILRGQVSEVDAGRLKVGQKVEVSLDALPDQTLEGSISWIGKIFRRASYNRPVKIFDFEVDLDNIDVRVLRPGMVAKVKIFYDSYLDVIAIPLSIIQLEGETSYVWVREENGPEKREIRVGDNNGVVAIVESGLDEGEEVASRPIELKVP